VRRTFFLISLAVLVLGCATMSFYRSVDKNKENVGKLTTGMSKDEVLKIMGTEPTNLKETPINNPYRIQELQGVDKTYEIIYYVTDVIIDDNVIDENELTPIVLSDGKVIGWGWGYMENIR